MRKATAIACLGILAQQAFGETSTNIRITMPGSPIGVAWGFLYGYFNVIPRPFMPVVRSMGGGFTKVYLFWNQIEPEKGKFRWDAVDAFVNQLNSPEEGLISLFSTSTWAVEKPGTMLPPSPAKNPDDYYQFVRAVVAHCKGRVRFWQNDSEPNNPIYWAGTKEQFVAELKLFHKAVKEADPGAVVVAGGYDGLFSPPGGHAFPGQEKGLAFFDYVMKEGTDAFDVFDLRLYGDPYTIPWRVEYIRGRMQSFGYEKPIISTEYGGPGFYEFPVNRKYAPLVMKWMQAVAAGHANGNPAAADAGQGGVMDLYRNMDQLAPQTQMFLQGCPAQLQAKFERIQARDLVMRNVLAFSAGIQKTLYWALHTDTPNRDDVMNVMFGKIALVDYQNGEPKRHPLADDYQRMAKELAGVETVTRRVVPDHPDVFLFDVVRRDRPPISVVWEKRDTFSGEDAPPTSLELQGAKGKIALNVSVTPIWF